MHKSIVRHTGQLQQDHAMQEKKTNDSITSQSLCVWGGGHGGMGGGGRMGRNEGDGVEG